MCQSNNMEIPSQNEECHQTYLPLFILLLHSTVLLQPRGFSALYVLVIMLSQIKEDSRYFADAGS